VTCDISDQRLFFGTKSIGGIEHGEQREVGNSMDEICVMWSEYKGHRYLDIRVYTEMGVTLRIPETHQGAGGVQPWVEGQ
jgi:hypothetical protein